eukprot:gene2084-1956_t
MKEIMEKHRNNNCELRHDQIRLTINEIRSNLELKSKDPQKIKLNIVKGMRDEEKCEHISDLLNDELTKVLFFIQLFTEPTLLKAVVEKELKMKSDELKIILKKIQQIYPNLWNEYTTKIYLNEKYATVALKYAKSQKINSSTTPKSTSNENTEFFIQDEIIETFSVVNAPKNSVQLDQLDDYKSLKGQILFFQKINFGDHEDYKLCCNGETEKFSNYFFLDQNNTRLIKSTHQQEPMYIKGKVINIREIEGGLRYNLQQGTKIVLIKYEARSKRVKGVAFHPKRPWLLTSLHSGQINLYDYRMGTLLEVFAEHEGPVRGIHFHETQPLFVSGGDDYKVKVWNYKLKRCLFTLTGHLDYIRTVQFHPEQPWIISASDDNTVRVWNWQSRQCMSILTGHNHYVMSAFFHPREDLIVTASLDQSVRVWDSSGLKQKTVDDYTKVAQLNQDLFGSNDVMVKFILEGHERGVNWAYFHPTLQLIVSGADDKVVKLWRFNDTRAWEIDNLRGHSNNVSCAIFHSQQDYVISNSEDKSIRVWDFNKNTFLYSYKRENDRFWVLNCHPKQNLVAAGHDNGVIVFKFERERPASCVYKGVLYYVKDKYLRQYNFDKNIETTIGMIKKQPMRPIRNLSFVDGVLLITVDNESQDSNDWEYLKITNPKSSDVDYCSQLKKGSGYNAVFSGRKMVYLDKNRNIQVENTKTGQFKQVSLSIPSIESIFSAHPGRILIKTEEKIYLYDFEQSSIIAEITAPGTKYVIWSEDMSRIAFMSKHNIVLTTGKLEELCSLHEIIRIKSGAFDENGVLIYTTLNHMKYCLEFGDSGIIKTIEDPIYLVKVKSNGIYYLDREGNCNLTYIDATEYRFKLALSQGKTRQVKEIMSKSTILGDSIISYLQKKGYPQVAFKFVQDDLTKFKLAIECGNIKSALSIAHKLKNNDCWDLLAQEALEQGDYEIVEKAYQRTNSYDKLSFLYLINGNMKDLQMMSKIANMRKDNMSRFHNALLLGDVESRVQVLEDSGQIQLAYVTAKTHGLEDKLKHLETLLGEDNIPKNIPEKSTLILPPTPVYKLNSNFNWPLLTKQEQINYDDDDDEIVDSVGDSGNLDDISLGSGWTDGIQLGNKDEDDKKQEEEKEEEIDDELGELGGGAWGGGLSDIGIDMSEMNMPTGNSEFEEIPTIGKSIEECWIENSDLAVDHIAAGSFRTAMDILSKQCGIINFTPLKSLFLTIYSGSKLYLPTNPITTSVAYSLQLNQTDDIEETREKTLPVVSTPSVDELKQLLKPAFKEVTDGKFSDAKDSFTKILHTILFVVVRNRKEEKEVKEILKQCMEYIVALRMETIRKETKDTKKGLELSAYFTHAKLSQIHLMLSLVSTMTVHYKAENFSTAAGFAKRLKKLSPPAKLEQQANFVLQAATKNSTNKFDDLNYEPKNPFVICSASLTPIYAGSESINCSYCFAPYLKEYDGNLFLD